MSSQFQQEVFNNLGNLPIIFYGSYQIEIHDIYYFSLFYRGGIPYFKMSFYDTLNLLRDKAFPLDDAKIKLFLNPRSEQLKEILIQFKIISFTISEGRYNIEGIIDVDLLHVIQYKSYSNLTSHKVLQQIAKEAGVGFNTNIDDTDDAMTWINSGNYVSEFMEEITESSYISDDSFMASFVDFYYNFNFVDLAKELDRNIDAQMGITDRSLSDVVKTTDPEIITNLLITNDESLRETNLFFETYKIINNSTGVSLQSGYKNIVKYYDELSKDLLVFNIDSITSQTNTSIILKGSPQDENFFNMNTNTYYVGKFDSDNCHKNYNFAFIQNEKNLFDLEKIGMDITMRTPNFGIYKYQKIKVFLSNQTATPSESFENERLSGDWLVIDIKYIYSQGVFRQILKLIKRELELSDVELSNEPTISNFSNGNNTSNKVIVNTFANSIASPGGNTSSIPNTGTASVNTILTKDIWNLIYNGRVNQKIIQTMYTPVVSALNTYGINTASRICAFLSIVNIVSSYLLYVTETDSGAQYDNNAILGNGPNDGAIYKGRGLIQILGRNMYQYVGKILNQDLINNPTTVAADNATHLSATDTNVQLNNCVVVSIIYWMNISTYGNLNKYADNMDISKAIDTGSLTAPNNQTSAANSGYQTSASNNFSTVVNSFNSNLQNFTNICFGVNGGYNGYSDSINEWNRISQYFQ